MPFLFTIFALLSVATFYLSFRLWQALRFKFQGLKYIFCLIPYLLVAAVVVLGFMRSKLFVSGSIKDILAVLSSYFMGFFFYLFIFTIAADIVFLIYRLIKRSSDKARLRFVSVIAATALTIVTVAYGIFHATQLCIAEYEITVDKELSREWRVVLVSDIHLGAVNSEGRIEKIVRGINEADADIVCIAGDFFDNDISAIKDPEKAIKSLKEIKSKHGVYMCLGNHDAGKSFPEMLEFIENCNIKLLCEEHTVIGDEIAIVGRVNRGSIGGFGSIERIDTNKVMSSIDADLVNIVMDHDPAKITEYGNETDLILSGHTHNGHMFPGNIINEFNYTVNYGYYRENENSPQVIVTSGAGTWGMPMRVGTDSEIAIITLKQQ